MAANSDGNNAGVAGNPGRDEFEDYAEELETSDVEPPL